MNTDSKNNSYNQHNQNKDNKSHNQNHNRSYGGNPTIKINWNEIQRTFDRAARQGSVQSSAAQQPSSQQTTQANNDAEGALNKAAVARLLARGLQTAAGKGAGADVRLAGAVTQVVGGLVGSAVRTGLRTGFRTVGDIGQQLVQDRTYQPVVTASHPSHSSATSQHVAQQQPQHEVVDLLSQLATLHAQDILDDEEFKSQKTKLLERL